MLKHLPNFLTYLRIIAVPLLFFCFYSDSNTAVWAAFFIFVIASITDYLDGYLARKFNVVSPIGRCLDPIADKLLVATVIMFLMWKNMLGIYGMIPAAVIILREILVSGLREFLSLKQISMPVTKLAKWKTATQMLALSLLLLYPFLNASQLLAAHILLWTAGVLTAITGFKYFTFTIRSLK